MQTYLFYDIETTGLNKAFDQILHFAAIRTDLALNELERYELKVKLNKDTIPSPRATITHHISIQETLTGISELDAILQIHQWLNTPGTISIGYNSLGFDDEFLRFSFYRHLLPPYTHQFANQCSRMDLYPIAVMYYLYKTDVLRWPTIDGETKLKLELINAENQFVKGRSHHAMIDVEVTLALAKRFLQSRDMWDYATGYFNKSTDQTRSQQTDGLMLFGKFGANQFFQCPVLYLGESRHYKNQTLWLLLDKTNLNTTTENTIAETTWVIRKKWGEPGFILPYKERFLHYLNSDRQKITAENKLWLQHHPALFQKMIDYHCNYTYPIVPHVDSEASLYLNGFWSRDEENFCRRFHLTHPTEKAKLTEQIQNPPLKTLAIRLLGRHYPEALTEQQKKQFADYMQTINTCDEALIPIDFKGNKRLTSRMALNEITELRKQPELDPQQHHLLNELEAYLLQQFASQFDNS